MAEKNEEKKEISMAAVNFILGSLCVAIPVTTALMVTAILHVVFG